MKRLVHAVLALLMTMGAALAADLPLGPGDVMKVSVYGSPDLTLETRVSEGGSISFPLIGQVAVGGLSTVAAERKIAQALESGGYVKKPQVNIIVTAVQSNTVSVLGQVIAHLLGLQDGECAVKKGAVWWLRNRERESGVQTVVVTVQSPEVL